MGNRVTVSPVFCLLGNYLEVRSFPIEWLSNWNSAMCTQWKPLRWLNDGLIHSISYHIITQKHKQSRGVKRKCWW